MSTLDQHIAARRDADLLARCVAAAEIQGIPNAQAFVEANMGSIVAAQIDGDTTVADVHAYAVATYQPTPRPGENPAAVTDVQIGLAVDAVHSAQAN